MELCSTSGSFVPAGTRTLDARGFSAAGEPLGCAGGVGSAWGVGGVGGFWGVADSCATAALASASEKRRAAKRLRCDAAGFITPSHQYLNDAPPWYAGCSRRSAMSMLGPGS